MAYDVVATSLFEADLDSAVAYYLEQAGPRSAARFLDKYDAFRGLVAALPGHGSPVGDSGLRWRQLGMFVMVYSVRPVKPESQSGERGGTVTLLRLYYVSQGWHRRVLGG